MKKTATLTFCLMLVFSILLLPTTAEAHDESEELDKTLVYEYEATEEEMEEEFNKQVEELEKSLKEKQEIGVEYIGDKEYENEYGDSKMVTLIKNI
ncbi:hypothetical protein [Natranaerobius trueperi]|uniref:Uncharacterized protein n=1 Tax=Natranaerobius trueperi TaxID=759412 RepID=A0A226BV98_9FIRM|nr:hypothetical protein [Natranaerobius trueperi]OWZ82682.1 hypothetical protein CDO51_12705 [Natranaerobius trueperi]